MSIAIIAPIIIPSKIGCDACKLDSELTNKSFNQATGIPTSTINAPMIATPKIGINKIWLTPFNDLGTRENNFISHSAK